MENFAKIDAGRGGSTEVEADTERDDARRDPLDAVLRGFYPTPPDVASRMMAKTQITKRGRDMCILEPSAGKGDLIEAIREYSDHGHRPYEHADISAIEIDETLQATLRGKSLRVIDSDFLTYSGPDKFDLIIMNPPFADGEKHLLKAMDIMYCGQIVCLLNAETLRNPFSNTRRLLARRLAELNAEIEYIDDAFSRAERKADVDVALISIVVHRQVEDDLFAGADDKASDFNGEAKPEFELSTGRHVSEMVAEYNRTVEECTEIITKYFRHYKRVCTYIGLNRKPDQWLDVSNVNLTGEMQKDVNAMLKSVRKEFWRKTLDLKEVKARMTSGGVNAFERSLGEHSYMDFTEHNIRTFVLNLIRGFDSVVMASILATFDTFTRHGYRDNYIYEKNIHYFNGWKTNHAYKVGKRVIIPIYVGYGDAFYSDTFHRWQLARDAEQKLNDFDLVMNYLDGMGHYSRLSWSLSTNLDRGIAKGSGDYFDCIAHKKGTIHLTFRDENILRRFNVAACIGKGWLPDDYGQRTWDELAMDERTVAESFEGEASYNAHVGEAAIPGACSLQLLA